MVNGGASSSASFACSVIIAVPYNISFPVSLTDQDFSYNASEFKCLLVLTNIITWL